MVGPCRAGGSVPALTLNDDFPREDGGGFDAEDWTRLRPFAGAVATLDDVQARRAVFALAETDDPRPIAMELPQPVIWWDDDGPGQAAVAVQAETHLGLDGEEMEVLGLILPDGGGAVALMEDVDLVDADPTWRELVANAIDPSAADD